MDKMLYVAMTGASYFASLMGWSPATAQPLAIACIVILTLLNALGRYGFGPGGLPVFIQSFDPDFLRGLRNRTRIPLIMLVGVVAGGESITLEQMSAFADGVIAKM